ncbi:MAG TPA: hypothetical protein VFZ34_09755, partial [Blastocatellia bacterium]|nr:hypothetical protein [Blastocatellia bacterium]
MKNVRLFILSLCIVSHFLSGPASLATLANHHTGTVLPAAWSNGTPTPHPQGLSGQVGQGNKSISANQIQPGSKQQMVEKFGQLPLSFEANQGQAGDPIKFISRGSGYALYLTPTGTILSLRRTGATADTQPIIVNNQQVISPPSEQSDKQDMLQLRFPGANSVPLMEGIDKLPGKVNYFIGNEPQAWHKDIATYARVKYENLYPGVDMIWYGNQRQLEFDFVVAPGSSPRRVRLAFDGIRGLRLDKRGDLLLRLEGGTIRQHRPIVWQEINGERKIINARYVLSGKNEIGFVVGRYDKRHALVIDPVLSWSTYLGGTSSDIGMAIATDNSGVYLTGSTFSLDFPSAGASAIKGGFFRSADNGSSWTAHPGLILTDINTIAIDPITPSTLFLGTNNFGIYKSTGGGTTGTAVNTGLGNFPVQALTINPSNPAILYAATTGGVFKSTNRASWSNSSTGLPVGVVRALAIDPLNPNTIYAGTSNGVFKSVNSGANWISFSAGLSAGGLSVSTIVINPLNPNELYVGTSDRIFKS